jgi:hypothetical protein
MTQPDYSLNWILPIVRKSLKGTGNLDYGTFMQNLWMRLEEIQVVKRLDPIEQQMQRRTFEFDRAPNGLMTAANEAFFYLFRSGYMVPQSNGGSPLTQPNFLRYDITERGRQWAEGSDPVQELTRKTDVLLPRPLRTSLQRECRGEIWARNIRDYCDPETTTEAPVDWTCYAQV